MRSVCRRQPEPRHDDYHVRPYASLRCPIKSRAGKLATKDVGKYDCDQHSERHKQQYALAIFKRLQ